MAWDYDRIEIIADGIIHATGISLGLVGAIAIIIVAVDLPRIEITSIVIYILSLVAMLVISGTYNMWPISPTSGPRKATQLVAALIALKPGRTAFRRRNPACSVRSGKSHEGRLLP